jgi:hypothetical protein
MSFSGAKRVWEPAHVSEVGVFQRWLAFSGLQAIVR